MSTQPTTKTKRTAAPAQTTAEVIELQYGKEARIDSRLLAKRLGVLHKSTFELIHKHKDAFLEIGILPFKTEVIKGRGQPEKFALLNEDQAYFLLTMSRNTARVVRLKLDLVKAFAQARKRMTADELEYLPAYHELHDAIARAAGDSPNARWAYINANKAINKAVGIEAGQRKSTSPIAHSMLTLATAVAAQAVAKAGSIKEVQPAIKAALQPLTQIGMNGRAATLEGPSHA